jgi:hypothetical protein
MKGYGENGSPSIELLKLIKQRLQLNNRSPAEFTPDKVI